MLLLPPPIATNKIWRPLLDSFNPVNRSVVNEFDFVYDSTAEWATQETPTKGSNTVQGEISLAYNLAKFPAAINISNERDKS